MIPSAEELNGYSDSELKDKHNKETVGRIPGIPFYYLDELHRRIQARQTKAIKNLTIWITIMTTIMTIATIVNVVLFFQVR